MISYDILSYHIIYIEPTTVLAFPDMYRRSIIQIYDTYLRIYILRIQQNLQVHVYDTIRNKKKKKSTPKKATTNANPRD